MSTKLSIDVFRYGAGGAAKPFAIDADSPMLTLTQGAHTTTPLPALATPGTTALMQTLSYQLPDDYTTDPRFAGLVPGAGTTRLWQFTVGGRGDTRTDVAVLPLRSPPPLDPYPVSLAGIRAKLVGLDSWLAAAARQEIPYDNARIVKNIPAMLKMFERETTIQVRGCQVVTRDDGTYTKSVGGKLVGANGLPYKKEEAYTYYPDNAYNYFLINLKTRPVQAVQRCRIMFKDTTVLEIPPAWYDVDSQSGQFSILPVQGSLLFAEYSSTFALLQAGFQNRTFIPHVVQFDYVAGLPNGWEEDDDHADLLRCLEEFCALSVLNDVAHLADAGLSGKSISGGGTGESYNYTRFADRKAELAQSVKDFVDIWKGQESPFMMAGL